MKITWEVDDGYVGKSAPHVTEIDDDELAECETEDEREWFIQECIHEDFLRTVTWHETGRES